MKTQTQTNKGLNGAKSRQSTVDAGTSGLIAQLEADHRELQDLLDSLLAEDAHDIQNTQDLFEGFKEKLEAHSKAEEEVLYATLRQRTDSNDDLHRDVMEGYQEHHVVDMLVREAERLNPLDEDFTAKLTVISELLDHHIAEEENDLFKKAAKTIGRDEMRELGESFARKKKLLFTAH